MSNIRPVPLPDPLYPHLDLQRKDLMRGTDEIYVPIVRFSPRRRAREMNAGRPESEHVYVARTVIESQAIMWGAR